MKPELNETIWERAFLAGFWTGSGFMGIAVLIADYVKIF